VKNELMKIIQICNEKEKEIIKQIIKHIELNKNFGIDLSDEDIKKFIVYMYGKKTYKIFIKKIKKRLEDL